MRERDKYVMLIASLPSPEALFAAKQPPLSRLKLDQRLRVLDADDADRLRQVEDALDWHRLPITVSDQDAIARGRDAIVAVDSDTLKRIIRDRLEIRTAVAALRRRAHGDSPPSERHWGFGRWPDHIVRNWNEPGFRLDGVFPWLRDADRMLREQDAKALERLLLGQAYRQLQRHAGVHLFDLEAVIIYVLKWNIVDRSVRYNSEAAARRFAELIETGLGEHTMLFNGVGA